MIGESAVSPREGLGDAKDDFPRHNIRQLYPTGHPADGRDRGKPRPRRRPRAGRGSGREPGTARQPQDSPRARPQRGSISSTPRSRLIDHGPDREKHISEAARILTCGSRLSPSTTQPLQERSRHRGALTIEQRDQHVTLSYLRRDWRVLT